MKLAPDAAMSVSHFGFERVGFEFYLATKAIAHDVGVAVYLMWAFVFVLLSKV